MSKILYETIKHLRLNFLVLLLVLLSLSLSLLFSQIPVFSKELKVPKNFVIQKIAEDLGPVRHIAVAPNGDIYAKLLHTRNNKGILVLRSSCSGDVGKNGGYSDNGDVGKSGGVGKNGGYSNSGGVNNNGLYSNDGDVGKNGKNSDSGDVGKSGGVGKNGKNSDSGDVGKSGGNLKVKTKNEKYEIIDSFGNYGGTGIAISGKYLYASSNDAIYKYEFNDKNEIINKNAPLIVAQNLTNHGQHGSKSITLDTQNNLYVNIGAYSNSCQTLDRFIYSKGRLPCLILNNAGGIWKFSSNKLNQELNDGERFATGLRNVVGLDWNKFTHTLFVMQHGRDQLHQNFPKYFNDEQNAELPAECMYELSGGENAGWPYTYFNPVLKKIMLAPEYGGDGKKEFNFSKFSQYIKKPLLQPTLAFPAHLAPNALLFYTGKSFPLRYLNGAFIAFHGSWNRAPLPQKGFNVVFVPFLNKNKNQRWGKWEIFAEGFSKIPFQGYNNVKHRPTGLAQDLNGNLYISDDKGGAIFKVEYLRK